MYKRIVMLFVLLHLSMMHLHAFENYELGNGVQVGTLPFYLGGYFSLGYKSAMDKKEYNLDDLAVLGYGSYGKFSYLVELELKDFYIQTDHEQNDGDSDGDDIEIKKDHRFYKERLYLDYQYNQNYTFRAGKYNSPIGFWNLVPVNVLRETTSSPLLNEIIYPKFTTGINTTYTSFQSALVQIDVSLQNNKDLDSEYNNYEVDQNYALGITYEKERYSFKSNLGYFRSIGMVAQNQKLYYALLAGKYEDETYQLQAEAALQYDTKEFKNSALYVQGLYRFYTKHAAIVRYEYFKDEFGLREDSLAIAAYTYRPLYPVAFKAEWQKSLRNMENRYLFSMSVLF